MISETEDKMSLGNYTTRNKEYYANKNNNNKSQTLRGLEWALTILEWDDEEIAMALHSIKNYKWLMSVEQLILENKEGWSLGMISEIMSLNDGWQGI